jgi:hypothetical protein
VPGVDVSPDNNDASDPYSKGPYTTNAQVSHRGSQHLAQQSSYVETYQKDDLQGWSSTRGI